MIIDMKKTCTYVTENYKPETHFRKKYLSYLYRNIFTSNYGMYCTTYPNMIL